MKWIGLILLAVAIAFSLGGRVHAENFSKSPATWFTFDQKDNLWKNWKKQKQPTVRPATSAWGTRTKNYTQPSMSGTSTKTQPVKAAPGSLVDTYQKSMSAESLQKWKQESIDGMQSGRNPFVEAFKKDDSEKK